MKKYLVVLLIFVFVACQPMNEELSINRAQDLLKEGNIDDAIDVFEDLIDEDEDDHELWEVTLMNQNS